MKNHIDQRIMKYNSKGGKQVGRFVAYQQNEIVYIGFSLCSSEDTFDKDKAKKIAYSRADNSRTAPLKIPCSIMVDFQIFLLRCERYFKTNNLPEFKRWSSLGRTYVSGSYISVDIVSPTMKHYLDILENEGTETKVWNKNKDKHKPMMNKYVSHLDDDNNPPSSDIVELRQRINTYWRHNEPFLEFISQDNEVEMLNESRYPLIGVFWLYNNEIIGDTRDPTSSEDTVTQTIESSKIVSGRYTHFDIWKKLKPDELKNENHLYLPRGRVVSDDTNFKFIIFANKIFDSLENRIKIKRYFNLSERDIIWNFNEAHYNYN